jgi:dihydrofolate reductase
VVFSTTLPAVQGHARLASGGVAEEIERLRAEPGEGDIAIGGATLAAEAAALGLIDEYRARVYPVPSTSATAWRVPVVPRDAGLEPVRAAIYGSS